MQNTGKEKKLLDVNDALLDETQKKREEQIKNFSLHLDVEDIVAEVVECVDNTSSNVPPETISEPTVQHHNSVAVPSEHDTSSQKTKKSRIIRKKRNKTLSHILYAAVVIVLSAVIALTVIFCLFEVTGLNKSTQSVEIKITPGANTQTIAQLLEDKGIISNAFIFRSYAKMIGADIQWQVGDFIISPSMGMHGIIRKLQSTPPLKSVNVTIPEGSTVEDIAKILEKNEVCSQEDFFNAVLHGEFDYDFVKDIPTAQDGQQHAGRIYRLEGYLFPDTYNFYIDSSAEIVIQRMLANFDKKLSADLRQQIADKGWTMDEAIIFASIIEGEAGNAEDMYAVSKVLTNRMQPHSGFPKLQCDSTRDYVRSITAVISGVNVAIGPYDTYTREGLPVGAINNPGLQAIKAALNPSTDAKYQNCYYFATDYKTGITYYSKTLAQHEAICRRYKIGKYG